MSSTLRRAIALLPTQPDRYGTKYELRYTPDGGGSYPNVTDFYNSQTKWVRLWASWPLLQPTPSDILTASPAQDNRSYAALDPPLTGYTPWLYPYGVGYYGGTVADYVTALDHEIRVGKFFGRKVLLTFTGFPTWANGTNSLRPPSATWRPDVDPGPSKRRVPSSVGTDSPWASALRWILRTWSVTRLLDGLEIMNEPNLQWLPQQDGQGNSTVAACYAAQMMQTALNVAAIEGTNCPYLAPAASDHHQGSGPYATNWSTFVGSWNGGTGLLGQLRNINFTPFALFAWSQHNYNDVAYDIGAQSQSGLPNFTGDGRTFARRARQALIDSGSWNGWPSGDSGNPGIWLTEGGVDISPVAVARLQSAVPGVWPSGVDARAKQASLVTRNWNRMAQVSGWGTLDGSGVQMVTNYLLGSTASFDSGLRNPPTGYLPSPPPPGYGTADAARPAFTSWSQALPSYQG